MGGVPPRVRVSAPSSDFVAPFLFSPRQNVARKRRGRAECSGRSPPPPLWGTGAYRAAAGASPHSRSPSLDPLQGPHPRRSQEGTGRHLSKETLLF